MENSRYRIKFLVLSNGREKEIEQDYPNYVANIESVKKEIKEEYQSCIDGDDYLSIDGDHNLYSLIDVQVKSLIDPEHSSYRYVKFEGQLVKSEAKKPPTSSFPFNRNVDRVNQENKG